MKYLTKNQAMVYRFIKLCGKDGFFPTYYEIMHQFHMRSPNGVTQYLRSLQEKGLIKKNDNKWVLVKGFKCPVCGCTNQEALHHRTFND